MIPYLCLLYLIRVLLLAKYDLVLRYEARVNALRASNFNCNDSQAHPLEVNIVGLLQYRNSPSIKHSVYFSQVLLIKIIARLLSRKENVSMTFDLTFLTIIGRMYDLSYVEECIFLKHKSPPSCYAIFDTGVYLGQRYFFKVIVLKDVKYGLNLSLIN